MASWRGMTTKGFLKGVLVVLGAILVLAVLALVVLTRTDPGQEQLGGILEGRLDGLVEGDVEVGAVSGSLVSDAVLHDVVIDDILGRPVLRADSLLVDYSPTILASLIPEWVPLVGGRSLGIDSVRLVGPRLTLSRRAGEPWNIMEILPARPETEFEPPEVDVDRIVTVDAQVRVEVPWTPPEELEGEARDRAVARAVSDESRIRVEALDGGWQRVILVRSLDAVLRDLGPVGPDGSELGVEIAYLDGRFLPSAPPALAVDDLTTDLRLSADSLVAGSLRLALSDSDLQGRAAWSMEEGSLSLEGRVEPLSLSDLTWLRPDIPEGRLSFALDVQGPLDQARISARSIEGRVAGARLAGEAELTMPDPLRIVAAELAVEDLEMEAMERLAPSLEVPVRGTAGGELTLEGTPEELDLDARVTFDRQGGGRSVMTARGGVGFTQPGVTARRLHVGVAPLRLELVEAVAGLLPVAGLLSGEAVLSGSPSGRLEATEIDLTHRGPGGASRLVGAVTILPGDPRSVVVDTRLPRLALATLDTLVSGPPLEGSASGTLQGRGTLQDLTARARLTLVEGGALEAEGAWDATGDRPDYRLDLRLDSLELAGAAPSLPPASLSGRLELDGRGTTPATMSARVESTITATGLDSAGPAEMALRVRVDSGRARVERGELSLASARGTVEGDFGLVEGVRGTLDYQLQVDSLSDFAHHLPGDKGLVRPRPLEQARRLSAARADSARRAERTRVERAATGRPAPPRLEPDTLGPLSRDSLSGSLTVQGTLEGNSYRFDLTGRAEAGALVVAGHAVAGGRLSYQWLGADTEDPAWTFEAALDEPRLAGFAFDSMRAEGRLEGKPTAGDGRVTIAVHQDRRRDFGLQAAYHLDLEGASEIRLEDSFFRQGERRWTDQDTATLRWTGQGRWELRRLDLRDGRGGRVQVDGVLRADGGVRGAMEVERLPVEDVLAVMQDTARLEGLANLGLQVRGTRARPRLEGELGFREVAFRDTPLPGLRGTGAYDPDPETLTLNARLVEATPADSAAPAAPSADDPTGETGRTVARIDARIPARITASAETSTTLHRDRPLSVEMALDSLRLDPLSAFLLQLSDIRGSASGNILVEGDLAGPRPGGRLSLRIGSVGADPVGVTMTGIRGDFQLEDDVVRVDTLIARTGAGTLRIGGQIGIDTLTSPILDLDFRAREAVVLGNDRGDLEADANLTVEGPLDSLRVGGRVTILGGTIYVQPTPENRIIELSRPLPEGIQDRTLMRESPILENLHLDVGLEVERGTWVRSPDARVAIFTPDVQPLIEMRMGAARGDILLEGELWATRGQYTLAGRRLELKEGILAFVGDPKIDPLVQLDITHEVPRSGAEALVIEVNVTGSLRSPRVDLTSNAQPELSQSTLISLLLLGQRSSSLVGLSSSPLLGGQSSGAGGLGTLATQRLASGAVGSLLDDAASALQATGLDVVRVTPGELPAELVFQGYLENVFRSMELELGEYVTPRLFIAAQGRLTQVIPGARAEYGFGEGFTVRASWEPRYFPRSPTFREELTAERTRALAAFLLWRTRF